MSSTGHQDEDILQKILFQSINDDESI
jgi:hypothetical protein